MVEVDTSNCPQLKAVLCGGPVDGTVVFVPMLDTGRLPDKIKFKEGHSHESGSCVTTMLIYSFEPGRRANVDAVYRLSDREVIAKQIR